MATKRDPRIQKTTIFEEKSPFLFCKILSKSGIEFVMLSESPVRTFHCLFQHSVWIPFYLGEFHAVFTDKGLNFPGYLVKEVIFHKQDSETTLDDILEEFKQEDELKIGIGFKEEFTRVGTGKSIKNEDIDSLNMSFGKLD